VANSAQARKRAKQSESRRKLNASQRSAMRTTIKKVQSAIASGDKNEAQQAYQAAVPALDKAVSKGLIHQNKAARHKSRMNKHIRALA
jgi:small subunit ribosomal protein S20